MFKRLKTSLSTYISGAAAAPEEPPAEEGAPAEDAAAPAEATEAEAPAPAPAEEPASADPFRSFGNRSVAVWDDATATATVVRVKGKHFRTMGCFRAGAPLLFAEEALYLAEREALVLLREAPAEGEEGAPPPPPPEAVATREAYDLALSREPGGGGGRCPLPCYWTYAQLRGLGYVVCRPRAYEVGDGSRAVAPAAWDGRTGPDAGPVPLSFECHQPQSNFAKSRLGDPAFRVFVCATTGGSLPTVTQLDALLAESGDVPVKAAVAAGDGTVLLFDLTAGVPDVSRGDEEDEDE